MVSGANIKCVTRAHLPQTICVSYTAFLLNIFCTHGVPACHPFLLPGMPFFFPRLAEFHFPFGIHPKHVSGRWPFAELPISFSCFSVLHCIITFSHLFWVCTRCWFYVFTCLSPLVFRKFFMLAICVLSVHWFT